MSQPDKLADFETLHGRRPEVVARAPGRVNLIGEHTDYNGGFVLPTVIPQQTTVEIARRGDRLGDRLVRAASANLPEAGLVEFPIGQETRGRGWLDYVQGVTSVLSGEGFEATGFDLRIESDVPLGSGLSSSAALEVALLRGLRALFEWPLDDVRMALMGQRAENEFVGARCGIMDQMAVSLAGAGTALFLDARSLEHQTVPLPEDVELIVMDSGVAHDHSAGDYNTRRAECERACTLLDVNLLRELTFEDLPRVECLPEPLNRRARHVVSENERVLAAVEAMRRGELKRLGELFYASHASMRDDYEVSVPAVDHIVELARQDEDVFGARLTGGGFGGAVVMLAHAGRARAAGLRIADAYARNSGRKPTLLVPTP